MLGAVDEMTDCLWRCRSGLVAKEEEVLNIVASGKR